MKFNLIGYTLFVLLQTSVQTIAQQVHWTIELDSCASASSPRLTDLNGDGVLDVVLGDGIFDDLNDLGHINAIDGATGQLIWRRTSDFDKFNSGLFYDLNFDGVNDIIIGGRYPDLVALDGVSGQTIWTFDNTTIVPPTGWKHFYNQQLLPDLNNDGVPEILAANGGEQDSLPASVSRPPGFLLVIDGSNGALISYATVPDSAEVYCSPVVYDLDGDGQLEIVFGTGGETHPGSLWLTSLPDLLTGDISNAINLASNLEKGFIAAPALVDLNNDGTVDIVATSYEGYLVVIDGSTLGELWRFQVPNGESYVTPAIGHFTSSQQLDLFVGFGIGSFPMYSIHRQFLLSGLDGSILFQDSLGFNGMSSPVAADLDNDGFDELIYHLNYPDQSDPFNFGLASSRIRTFDFNDHVFVDVSPLNDGISWGSTPHVIDMDGNGQLDLIYVYSKVNGPEFWNQSIKVVRVELSGNHNLNVKWGAYQGSAYDGIYQTQSPTDISLSQSESNHDLRLSPVDSEIGISINSSNGSRILGVEMYAISGQLIYSQRVNSDSFQASVYAKTGLYLVRAVFSDGMTLTSKASVLSTQ